MSSRNMKGLAALLLVVGGIAIVATETVAWALFGTGAAIIAGALLLISIRQDRSDD